MRFLYTFILTFICFSSAFAQILEPVKWDSSIEKQNDSIYEITFTATIDAGWHLYSQEDYGEDGPLPTIFTFSENENFELMGKTTESDGVEMFDKVFEMDIKYFENMALFKQKVLVSNPENVVIEGEVEFMVCDDARCLPPGIYNFALAVGGGEAAVKTVEVSESDLEKTEALNLNIKGSDDLNVEKEEKSFLTIFFLGFIGGLIALLTPCVFPMIPLTVSFFTKSAGNKKKGLGNAILYGFFIFIIYLLLSLPFHLLDSLDPEILNNISTNVTLNIIFFIIFLVFAFSFFGFYEITLPAKWSNKMDDKASSIGGVIGIFFMALTLAIVSFSCTGPILGSLLGGSLTSDGGAMQLSFGMGGFGLALALPFALFALFPNWLNSLPKSGGWLNTVKVVLGFIELGLAFKFLSNADLVEHWGLLKREIFIGIWVVLAIGLALYLFGLIRFPHDGPKQKLTRPRIFMGAISIAFVLYLLPGLTNTEYANLKLLSGFPPPLFYSVYDKESEAPLGLEAYKDFEKGLAAAKAQGKPILLDFTGWACVNCRKMEEQVWSVPKVFEVINRDYILISLYVDDKRELSEAEQFNYAKPTGGTKEIRTIGDKWATFQTLNFRNNSQPYYVLLSPDLDLLSEPTGYTPDAQEYYEWLKNGVETFNNRIKTPEIDFSTHKLF
ncbi:MAG TPA: cytochrome c biogenesis protein CcdA [Salinimicrobium sp.]|nr:cytochrome c biogenesis protein CcdA [Salinimicrobium sp.]